MGGRASAGAGRLPARPIYDRLPRDARRCTFADKLCRHPDSGRHHYPPTSSANSSMAVGGICSALSDSDRWLAFQKPELEEHEVFKDMKGVRERSGLGAPSPEPQLQMIETAPGFEISAPIHAPAAGPLRVPPFNPPSSAPAVSVVQRSAPSAVLAVGTHPSAASGYFMSFKTSCSSC